MSQQTSKVKVIVEFSSGSDHMRTRRFIDLPTPVTTSDLQQIADAFDVKVETLRLELPALSPFEVIVKQSDWN